MPGVAALVNGEQLALRDLAEECVARHGLEILEGTITRKILEQACQRQSIAVSEKEMEQEIARAAAVNVKSKPDGSADVAAWLELVTRKQRVPLEVYRNDVVWPTVALKKLVGKKVEVGDEDLRKGYEANYGAHVRCLAIVLNEQRTAQKVFEMARRRQHVGEVRGVGQAILHGAGQQGAGGRSAADQEVRRPTVVGRGGLQAENRASSPASSRLATSTSSCDARASPSR